MTIKTKIFTLFAVFTFLLCASSLSAKDYKIAVAQLPITADAYLPLLKALGEETKNNFIVDVVPMARSINLIENKSVDLQLPLVELPDPKKVANLKFDYSTAFLYKTTFVLYTNKNKAITVEELKNGNTKNYKIETDTAHVNYFNFQCAGSTNIEASLKKVDSGAIDGFIYSQVSTDKVLKQLQLKTLHRQFFDKFNLKFLLPKGAKGSELDKILTDGINKLTANGKLDAILGNIKKGAETYDAWQP